MPLYSEPDPCLKLSVPSVIIPLPPTLEKHERAETVQSGRPIDRK
jgi:hypothetical protein